MTVTDGVPPFLIGVNVTVTCATGYAFSVNLTLNSTDRVVASQVLSCLDEPASAVGHWTQLTGNCTGKLHPVFMSDALRKLAHAIYRDFLSFHYENLPMQ